MLVLCRLLRGLHPLGLRAGLATELIKPNLVALRKVTGERSLRVLSWGVSDGNFHTMPRKRIPHLLRYATILANSSFATRFILLAFKPLRSNLNDCYTLFMNFVISMLQAYLVFNFSSKE